MARSLFRLETPQKTTIEPRSSSSIKDGTIHKEQRLQIDELDEWQSHVKEKPRIYDVKPKHLLDESKDGMNHFKFGD
ncbi:hypothetical protein GOBAR_AA07739 [Gossypium barbadense]|uniref:Uncharacterized protein n=1 Tax=Gossypium barbadense TaxID=3634 RepID=A0A2P5YBC8_GOSBA|nr:hypothetical protein GOBAR_AA07739 [Gossypium barbadense]